MSDTGRPRASVLVVDDHVVFADALRARLSLEPDLYPVIVAYHADDARVTASRHRPSVAVVDLDLGGRETGLDVADALRTTSPQTRTIILTGVESLSDVVAGLRLGVRAWLPKTVDVEHLLRVVRGVAAGEAWLSPELLGRVLDELTAQVATAGALAEVTPREREVLQSMLDGHTRAEIADRLHVSVHTVRTHNQHLLAKLGAHSTLELLAIARRRGLRASVQ